MAPRSVAIDVVEDDIRKIDPSLLRALLKDKTTGGNIIWATDDYVTKYGNRFACDKEIKDNLITGVFWDVIQPRTAKKKEQQDSRTKNRAEVFTPSWICNQQNNLIDEQWFGRKNVFNEEHGEEWLTFHDKIEFPADKSWQEYIDARRMEVTCGEAPYLVSRYDATTGRRIPLNRRIGLLDRKFRIINENATDDRGWLKAAFRALQATYGYDFQGDNVLLSRENVLFTFIDNYKAWFNHEPDVATLREAIRYIVWNIWQMDGRTYATPYATHPNRPMDFEEPPLFKYFDFGIDNKPKESPPPEKEKFCYLMNWRKKEKFTYKSLIEGGKNAKK